MKSLIIFFVSLAIPAAAYAHDFWLQRQPDGFALFYGHRGGETLKIEASKLKAIKCARPNAGLKDLLGDASFTDKKVTVAGACAVVSAFYYGGFFSLTPDGEKNLPKSRCPNAVKAWESKQFAKWVDVRSPAGAKPIGDEFEIVPVTDLSRVKQDDKATFRVLLKGKPLEGAVMAINHKALGETDSSGEARVRIRASDFETISASYKRTISSRDADSQVFESTLTFAVSK